MPCLTERSRGATAVVAVLALLATWAVLALRPSDASAAACPSDLTVAGLKVQGPDCVTQGDGSIVIKNPLLGDAGAVKILDNSGGDTFLRINAARTEMKHDSNVNIQRLFVGSEDVVKGNLRVASIQICDLAAATPPIIPNGEVSQADLNAPADPEIVPATTNCRNQAGVEVGKPVLNTLHKIAGLNIAAFSTPLNLAVDNQKGGRVSGIFAFSLPLVLAGNAPILIGIGAENSFQQGFKVSAASFTLTNQQPIVTAIPGVRLRNASFAFDSVADRFTAALGLAFAKIGISGNLTLEQGQLKQLGATATFTPGLPFPPPPPALTLNTIGLQFQAGSSSAARRARLPAFATVPVSNLPPAGPNLPPITPVVGPAGLTISAPATLTGTAAFNVGPVVAGQSALNGLLALTIAGPTLTLQGDLFIGDNLLRLATATISVTPSPFRFEGQASVSALNAINGSVFFGVTKNAFTALGQLQIQVPPNVPLIGGTQIGGAQAVVSNIGAAGVITLGRNLKAGVGFRFSPFDVSFITSIAPFITIQPTVPAAASASVQALAARRVGVRFPRGLSAAVVAVEGRRRVPRRVRLLDPRGRRVRGNRVATAGKTVYIELTKPRGGRWRVRSADAIKRVTASRIKPFPYLDPDPGFGTRPHDPVMAGSTPEVCWRVKNAPKGAKVDIFEDTNGRLGTGSILAEDLPAKGCFNVPTAGLEPGRHWVYGALQVDGIPVSARYWPIAINIVDPNALGAPTGIQVEPTADGAKVSFAGDSRAGMYVVRAEPASPLQAEVVEAPVPYTSNAVETVELPLRGAANWQITVRSYAPDGTPGNPSAPVAVSPTDPVVLNGAVNNIAQVGKLWRLDLTTSPGINLTLVDAPGGVKLEGGSVVWRPNRAAGNRPPQQVVVQGCVSGGRCVRRSFTVSVLRRGIEPYGPARGFHVAPAVVKRQGGTVRIYAQGIDQKLEITVDGNKVTRVRRLDNSTVLVRLPRLEPGSHDMTLKVGDDPVEQKPDAFVVAG